MTGQTLSLPDSEKLRFHDDLQNNLGEYKMSCFKYIFGMLPRGFMKWLQRYQRDKTSLTLTGISAPVHEELFKKDLPVTEGAVPEGLGGMYIRTGPNVPRKPSGGYHLFDGDAMVHAVYFSEGKASTYHNHWLRTPRLLYELAFGGNLWPRLGDLKGKVGLALMLFAKAFSALMFPKDGLMVGQLGNTALTFHNGRLLALMEGSYPFLLRACKGLIKSIGIFNFGGALSHAYTAHPKVDPVTGHLHSFCYKMDGKKTEWCLYQVTSPSGVLSKDYPVDISRPQMMHDFAITENYVVFMDAALIFDPKVMVKEGKLPFTSDTETPCRIGLLKKADPAAPIQWFQVDPFVCFHTANAWEEAGTSLVHLALCKYSEIDLGAVARDPNAVDDAIPVREDPGLVRFSLDLSTGTATETKLVWNKPCEFPIVPSAAVGRSTPYAYTVAFDSANNDLGAVNGLYKVDLHASELKGVVGEIMLPEGYSSGEAAYVPRPGATAADDGWLIMYVTNKAAGASYCQVFDAKTMDAKPICSIALPQRVPPGFHGMFISQAQLDSQVKDAET